MAHVTNTVEINGIQYSWVIDGGDIILQTPTQDRTIEGGWDQLIRETENHLKESSRGEGNVWIGEADIEEHAYREINEFIKRNFELAQVSWTDEGTELLKYFSGLSMN